uniref:Uncharacterized protein TCIL3000_11_12170 n=1 Tax=Trypanosoma congolense (strain IL3000) TaxID=1068625 RepID=G0V252_TRYCI|nr:unnamed protein product [Trypanosoma congolense IL3000]
MDISATRRGADTGRKRHGPHFPVVIVGEVFTTSLEPVHSLCPVAPSPKLPFALLPICNTPIIDYILENLAENGVDEVFILLNGESVPMVQSHLKNNRTVRGRPWLECKDMKVHVVGSVRTLSRLCDVTAEIVEQNLVGQNSSFLFVPVDAVAVFTNLRTLFHMHVERSKTIKSYAATLVCTSVRTALEETLHNVLASNTGNVEGVTASLEHEPPLAPSCGLYAVKGRPLPAPVFPPNPLTMFTLQQSTGVVRGMVRLESTGKMSEATRMEFNERERVSVRSDLVPTGFLFCSGGALSLFSFPMADQHAFLVDLLAKHELWGNVFGVVEANTPMCVVQPINSLRTYIQANIDVCRRRFFPLTREYRFVEDRELYAASPHCPSVYLHQVGAKVLGGLCGPCVVVGEHVVVPPNAVVRGAVLGKGVSIGDGSVVVGCVLLDGAAIGRNCVLRNSLIGHHVKVFDKAELLNCIVGDGCVIGSNGYVNGDVVATNSSSGNDENNSVSSNAGISGRGGVYNSHFVGTRGVVLQDVVLVSCEEADADESVVGLGGVGRMLERRHISAIAPTSELFLCDPVPRNADSSDDDESATDGDDDDDETFGDTVRSLVEQALSQPSRMDHCIFQMKSSRLTFGRRNRDLCYVVTEHLLKYTMENSRSDRTTLLRRVEDAFAQWCSAFYSEMVTGDEEMQAILEAVCCSIGDPTCPLHKCGPMLLQCIYNDCDEELYEERGYCIVSGESLVEFDARMTRLSEQREEEMSEDDDHLDHRTESMIRVALSCKKFIADVRSFLEEESDGTY